MTQNENELMIKKIIYAWHIDYIFFFLNPKYILIFLNLPLYYI